MNSWHGLDQAEHDRIVRELEDLQAEHTIALEKILELEFNTRALGDVIADVCETLGHEGRDGDDLLDAVGQLSRLLEGKDLDDELTGVAAQLRRLVLWAHLGARALKLVLGEKAGVVVVLTPELASFLDSPLTGRQIFDLTTAPLVGVEFNEDMRGWFGETADMFNGVSSSGVSVRIGR